MTMPRKTSKPRLVKKRIVIVDDHPMTRLGLSQLLNGEPDLVVCGEAESAAAGFSVILDASPDLVLVDISLPGKSGLELIKDVHAVNPAIPMLVISMHSESIYAERSLSAGSRGYVMKNESGETVISAIRTVLAGGIAVSEKVSTRVLQNLCPTTSVHQTGVNTLTNREFEIFQLIGEGLAAAKIAKKLNIASKTVHSHLAAIRPKLGKSSMPELIACAATWAASQG